MSPKGIPAEAEAKESRSKSWFTTMAPGSDLREVRWDERLVKVRGEQPRAASSSMVLVVRGLKVGICDEWVSLVEQDKRDL